MTSQRSIPCKVNLAGEFRRFNFTGTTFEELKGTLKALFNFPTDQDINVTYLDEENDLITLSSDQELNYMLEILKMPLLRFCISKNEPLSSIPPFLPQPSHSTAPTMHLTAEGLPSTLPEPSHQLSAMKDHIKLLKQSIKAEKINAKQEWKQHKLEKKYYHHPHFHHQRSYFNRQGSDTPLEKFKLNSRFIKHVTVPDDIELPPGVRFVKTWRFTNSGNIPWTEGTEFLRVSRINELNAPDKVPVPRVVNPGEEIDISVVMVTPQSPGQYAGFWRLAAPSGKKFGQRVRVQVQVVGPNSESESGDEMMDVTEEEQEKWKVQLEQIQAMGFDAPKRWLIKQLKRHNGDLNIVVKQLVLRQSRMLGVTPQ